MKILSSLCLTALLFASAPAWAQGTSKDMKDMPGMQHGAMPSAGATSPAAKAFADANMKMHKDMTLEFTGNADVDFIKGMVPHHQGAIEMAEIELKYGTDSKARKLAREIIAAQKKEIAFMNAWLAKHPK